MKTEVWFYTNKQGHKLASRWSRQQFRSFPIGYEEARRRIAAGEAVEIPGHPFPNRSRSAYGF